MTLLKELEKMRTRRNKRKYCFFFFFCDDHGHLTQECIQLKDEIEALIHNGFLKEYISEDVDRRSRLTRESRPWEDRNSPPFEIKSIIADPT